MEENKSKFSFMIQSGKSSLKYPVIMERTPSGWDNTFLLSFSDEKDCRKLLNELSSAECLDIPPNIDMAFENIWEEAESGAEYDKIYTGLSDLFYKIETHVPYKRKR